ncbi:hypothetical protein GJ496_004268 [Pomphorhynchus laevis]|nr:hypothetical protein GJ496_004268 [Pomphorhynchus laevis]
MEFNVIQFVEERQNNQLPFSDVTNQSTAIRSLNQFNELPRIATNFSKYQKRMIILEENIPHPQFFNSRMHGYTNYFRISRRYQCYRRLINTKSVRNQQPN